MPYAMITEVLNKVGQDYAEAYAIAIAHTEKFPEHVNVVLADVLEATAAKNYDRALDSTSKAIDICYRVSVVAIWDRIEHIKRAIRSEGSRLPNNMVSTYKQIKSQKKKISGGQSPSGHVSPKLVFQECRKLHDRMLIEFNMTDEMVLNIRSKVWWSHVAWVVVGPPSAFFVGMMVNAYYTEIVDHILPLIT